MSDLKPCPFCGSEPESRISGNHVGAVYVNCHKCGLEMIASSIGSVSRKWNNRPSPLIFVDAPEDIEIKGDEILCWDGCDYSIDYVEVCADTGCFYMANGTEVIAYAPLPPTQED